MYVTPRPSVDDDPLYAVRLAFVGMLSYVAVTLLNPALPPVIAALPVGMVGAQRKAFNFGTAIGGPGSCCLPGGCSRKNRHHGTGWAWLWRRPDWCA